MKVTIELPAPSAEKLLGAYRDKNSEFFKYISPFNLLNLRVAKDYGAPELKSNYLKRLAAGLIMSIVICYVFLIVIPKCITYIFGSNEPVPVVRIANYSELGPPPSIAGSEALSGVMGPANEVNPTTGTPVPVRNNNRESVGAGFTSNVNAPELDDSNDDGNWGAGFIRQEGDQPRTSPIEESTIDVAPPPEPESNNTIDNEIEAPSTPRDVYIFDPWTTELTEEEKQYRRQISTQLIGIWRDLHNYLLQVRVVNENIIEIPIIRDNLVECTLVGRTNGQFRIKISSPRGHSMPDRNILRKALQVVLSL